MKRLKHNSVADKAKRLDVPLLITVLVLLVFGVIMVYDASVVQASKDFGDKYFYIKQQFIWMILGIGLLSFFSKLNYHNLRVLALPMLLGSIFLLIAVFIPGLGINAGGAHRWLKLGGVTLQPAEIVKLTTIVFFSSLFEKRINLLPFGIIVVFVSLVIGFLQKDLGSTIVFFLNCLLLFIYAGAPLKYFWSLIPLTFISSLIFIFSASYRKERILAFLDPFSDPRGYSYHIAQVLIALGSGGLVGLGIGQSRQKFEYIPEVTTDSIFAIVGEELGFLGAIVLIGLFSYLIYRGFKIVENCDDRFGKLLAFGLTIWLSTQAIINLSAMVSLIPLTGVPLPFISYGGSALLVNLVAVGILLNISKYSR